MWFELKMAVRFLISGRLQTLLIVLGITIGVAVQVFLGSLIGGLQQDLIQETIGSSPHITITAEDELPRRISPEYGPGSRVITFVEREDNIKNYFQIERNLETRDDLTAFTPAVVGSGFANRGDISESIVMRGVDREGANSIYNLEKRLESGQFNLGGSNVLIGKGLADKLSLVPGDTMRISTGDGSRERFSVEGVFDLGSQDLNNSWIFADISRAASFLGLSGNEVSQVEMQVEDVFRAEEISSELREEFPAMQIESWEETNADLLNALESQSASSLVIQFFVIVAVTLGIASVLAVSVVQKNKQIGIIKAIGARPKRVGRIFLIQGGLMGSIGAIMGIGGGLGLSQLFVTLVRDAAGDPLFPIQLDYQFLLISFIVATVAGMIAALVPARNSARLNTVEVIQNG